MNRKGMRASSRITKPKKLVRPPLARAAISSSGRAAAAVKSASRARDMPSPASMRGAPVRAGSDLDTQRHAEGNRRFGGAFHHLADDGRGALHLRLGHLEDQLVMDLHQHARA